MQQVNILLMYIKAHILMDAHQGLYMSLSLLCKVALKIYILHVQQAKILSSLHIGLVIFSIYISKTTLRSTNMPSHLDLNYLLVCL